MSDTQPNNELKNPEVSYEPQDLNVRGIVYFGIGLLAVIIIAMGLIAWMLTSMENQTVAEQAGQPTTLEMPPEPRLLPNPVDNIPAEQQLETLRAYEDKILHSYGWVDKEAGVVRIPIDEAMKRVVAENQ